MRGGGAIARVQQMALWHLGAAVPERNLSSDSWGVFQFLHETGRMVWEVGGESNMETKRLIFKFFLKQFQPAPTLRKTEVLTCMLQFLFHHSTSKLVEKKSWNKFILKKVILSRDIPEFHLHVCKGKLAPFWDVRIYFDLFVCGSIE